MRILHFKMLDGPRRSLTLKRHSRALLTHVAIRRKGLRPGEYWICKECRSKSLKELALQGKKRKLLLMSFPVDEDKLVACRLCIRIIRAPTFQTRALYKQFMHGNGFTLAEHEQRTSCAHIPMSNAKHEAL